MSPQDIIDFLKEIEWSGSACPCCHALFRTGKHEDDCRLHELLSRYDGPLALEHILEDIASFVSRAREISVRL